MLHTCSYFAGDRATMAEMLPVVQVLQRPSMFNSGTFHTQNPSCLLRDTDVVKMLYRVLLFGQFGIWGTTALFVINLLTRRVYGRNSCLLHGCGSRDWRVASNTCSHFGWRILVLALIMVSRCMVLCCCDLSYTGWWEPNDIAVVFFFIPLVELVHSFNVRFGYYLLSCVLALNTK